MTEFTPDQIDAGMRRLWNACLALGTGGPPMHVVFRARAESVGESRGLVARHLREAGCSADALSDAVLLTSEITTNAVTHAATETFTVDVDVLHDTVYVGIRDDDRHEPVRAMDGLGSESGRGLQLLEKIATRWASARGSSARPSGSSCGPDPWACGSPGGTCRRSQVQRGRAEVSL